MKYKIVAVKVGEGIVLGYVPNDNYFGAGDEVILDGPGTRGLVLLIEDYMTYEELQQRESDTGMELVKITSVLHKKEVKWHE